MTQCTQDIFLCHLFSFFLDSTIQSLQCQEVIEHSASVLETVWKNLRIFAITLPFHTVVNSLTNHPGIMLD